VSEAPELSHEELRAALGKYFNPRADKPDRIPRRKLAAVYGRTSPGSMDVAGERVEVVPVASEFELRAAMPEFHEDRPLAFVLGYPAVEIPVDIAGRFIKRGRVLRLGRHERLRRLLADHDPGDARHKRSFVAIDPGLVDSAFARYLLGLDDAERWRGLAGGSGQVTLEQVCAQWLHRGYKLPATPACDSYLAACAWIEPTTLVHALDPARNPEATGVREELIATLSRAHGTELGLILRCWLADKGRTLLELAVLFEAHAVAPDELLEMALLQAGVHALGLEEAQLRLLMVALPTLVPSALDAYQAVPGADLRGLLRAAEGHLRIGGAQRRLIGSRVLPIAWSLRLDAIGEALLRVLAAADADEDQARRAYADLSRSVVDLELHDFIRAPEHKRSYEQAEMARRLAAFLVVRGDLRWPVARTPVGKLEALAGWYAHEGGYVDLARERIRGPAEGRFGEGLRAVLAKVDQLRVQQDRAFAEGLPRWLEAGRPERRVLPIDKVFERFAAAFLRSEGGTRRKLMIIVMDGMAWTQTIELLRELGSEDVADPWHPLACNRELSPLEPHANLVPVLATLPTITDFSRSALFSGQPPAPGTTPRTTDDDRRFAKHPALVGLFGDGRSPTLLGPRESVSAEGLTPNARTLIADAQHPVVAFLLNTIDAALSGDRLDRAHWTIDRVLPLRSLFDAARESGRAVLLCSDHGHVSGQRLDYANRPGNGRWRTLVEGDKLTEFEVAIPSPPGWRPDEPGARGVVLIADDLHRYNNQPKLGSHGGASLAEVVVPTVLLGTPALTQTELGDDPKLALAPVSPPSWWVDEIREAEGRKAAITAATERQEAKQQSKVETTQLEIAAVAPTPSQAELDAQRLARAEAEAHVAAVEQKSRERGKKTAYLTDATTKLLDKLEHSPMFQARTRDPAQAQAVLAALEYLLEHQDSASFEAFAARVGKHQGRIAGVVSHFSEVLNVDGYDVLGYDSASKQIRVERELLIQCFGL
jgi:hypothetical protein